MIPLARPYFNDEELKEVKSVLDSGWVAQGPKCREFEEKFAKYIGSKYAVTTSSCTTALHLSLLVLGVKPKDEVLVPDFTFPATANAVLYVGAKPVFVDVEKDTYNIDPQDMEKKITSKTRAVIVVHTFGNPADMKRIKEIANKYNIKIIEDAACAHGAVYENKKIGLFGDIACFSFHARKNISTGEGGIIVTNDFGLAEYARKLATHGIKSTWKRLKSNKFIVPVFNELGYNYRLSDISAAVGIAQLSKLELMIEKRIKLSKEYNKATKDLDFITPQRLLPNVRHVYQSYVSTLSSEIDRNKLITLMLKKGVQTNIGTYALHIQPVYSETIKCQNSLKLFNQTIALPLFYELTIEELNFVIDKLNDCIKSSKKP